MAYKYLCNNWQALLEQIVNLCGNGYYYYHISYLPVRKKEKRKEIDKKIIEKYNLEKDTKDKRYQRKKKGLANFAFLRWEHILVILHTEGKIIYPNGLGKRLKDKGKLKNKNLKSEIESLDFFNSKQIQMYSVEYDDDFRDIHYSPIFLKISEQVEFNIQILEQIGKRKNTKKQLSKEELKKLDKNMKATVTVKMAEDMYNDRKAELLELVERQAKDKLLHSFNLLNRLPAWSGIIQQKVNLQHILIKHAKQHHMDLEYKNLFVYMRREKQDIIFVDKEEKP